MSYFGIPKIILGGLEQVPVSLATQDIAIDANNSYTGTIDANTVYNLTATAALPVTAIQVYISADQNCSVYVDQADVPDNLGAVGTIIDSFNYFPAVGNGSFIIAVAASYYRVRIKNLSLTTIANVIVETVAVPNSATLPRSLDQFGRLQTVTTLEDEYGFSVENTPYGELRTIIPTELVGSQFDLVAAANSPDPNFWSTFTSGTGSVVVQNSSCQIHSGTGAADYAKLASFRRARYIPGHANRFRSSLAVQNTQANNTKRWGVALYSNYVFTNTAATVSIGDVYSNNSQYFTVLKNMVSGTTFTALGTGAPSASGTLTKVSGAAASPATIAYSAVTNIVTPQDGVWFKLSESTLSLETCMGGTVTPITSFNGVLGSSYILDTNVHAYEIYWTVADVIFSLDGYLLHTFRASSTVWASSLQPYIYADNINTGNTTDTYFEVRNAAIHRLGPDASQINPHWKNIHGQNTGTVLKYGPGRLRKVALNNVTASTVISLYDSTVGAFNPIALISPPATLSGSSIAYDLSFYNGLYVVTSNVAAQDITIVYD
jgi:hypothetical protein